MNSPSNEPTVQQAFDLSGKVALVTGAGGYLGGAISRALAEAGARVIATSRDESRAEALARELTDPHGVGHIGIALDHLSAESINRGIELSLQRTGQIDVVVNNGHDPLGKDWSEVTAEQFSRQLANATGYFLLARCVRNHAVEREAPASIIMIGSMYGLVASYPDVYEELSPASPAAYQALKGGVIQLTRHLAVYWARDRVRVNCLSPGPFPQPQVSQKLVGRIEAKSPMQRIGKPHEIKGAVLLLASDAGSYITGHNLVVDGGWTAW